MQEVCAESPLETCHDIYKVSANQLFDLEYENPFARIKLRVTSLA